MNGVKCFEYEQNIGYKSRLVKHFLAKMLCGYILATVRKSDWLNLFLLELFHVKQRLRQAVCFGSVSRETRPVARRCRDIGPWWLGFDRALPQAALCRFNTSSTRFCRSLGETPGILPAWASDSGRTLPSFSLASVLMLRIPS